MEEGLLLSEDVEELPTEVCKKEFNGFEDKCPGKDGYKGCTDPRKTDKSYCNVLQDWPQLKSLTAKSSIGVSMAKSHLIEEADDIEHCPHPEHCPKTYSACTDSRKAKPGYCTKTISKDGDPEQYIIEDY